MDVYFSELRKQEIQEFASFTIEDLLSEFFVDVIIYEIMKLNYITLDSCPVYHHTYHLLPYKYVKTPLTGDVGGYMGLLLGASVVTVFELLDFIIYNLFKKATGSKSDMKDTTDVHVETKGSKDNAVYSSY